MSSSQQKPKHTPAGAPIAPVDQERVRALQARIERLRQRAATAQQTGSQIQDDAERLRAEAEQAERQRRAAEKEIALLRAQAVAAQRSAEVEPPRRQPEPSPRPAPVDSVQVTPAPVAQPPAASDLLARAEQAIIENRPEAREGQLQLSGGEPVMPSDLDFGPLIEEPDPAPTLGDLDVVEARVAPSEPLLTPASTTPVRPAPTRAPAPKPARDSRQTVKPAARHLNRRRSVFRPALLSGVLLGGAAVLAWIQWAPQTTLHSLLPTLPTTPAATPVATPISAPVPAPAQAQSPPPPSQVPAVTPHSDPATATNTTPTTGADWRHKLLQREQTVRKAAHQRFETLRAKSAALSAVAPTPTAPPASPDITDTAPLATPAAPVAARSEPVPTDVSMDAHTSQTTQGALPQNNASDTPPAVPATPNQTAPTDTIPAKTHEPLF